MASQFPVWESAGVDRIERKSSWDTVSVGGRELPGIARVSGAGIEHGIDIRKTPKKDGATFTDLGRELGKFRIVLVLHTQEDLDSFVSLRSSLQPLNSTGKLQALEIVNPSLNILGVRSVYFTRIGVPQPGSVVGTYEIELETLEYKPTRDVSASVTTPKKNVTNWNGGGNGYPPGSSKVGNTKP